MWFDIHDAEDEVVIEKKPKLDRPKYAAIAKAELQVQGKYKDLIMDLNHLVATMEALVGTPEERM